MKLDARRVGAFLKDPRLGDSGACRVVLLHGEDAGLIRDRAEALVRSVAGSLDDPFLVADLNRDTIDRLGEEASALSMTGGRRVVRLREATDAAAERVRAILAGGFTALLVIEAPGLAGKAKLRTLVEAAPDAAAIACYPEEGRDLEQTIRGVLAEARVSIDGDAMAWLVGQLGADRGATRNETEKLATYAGPGGRVDLDAAMACVGDLAGLSLDDALFAATAGDIATADRALELAMAEGATAVGVIRGGMLHLQRLHRVAAGDGRERHVGDGRGAFGAPAGVFPPPGRIRPRDGTLAGRGAGRGRLVSWRRRSAPASAPARRTRCFAAMRCLPWRAGRLGGPDHKSKGG